MSTTRKIRILEGIRQGKIGGGESYLLSLIENLDRTKFEPVVLSFTDGPMVERLRNMGVTTHIIYTEKPFDFRVWKKVKKLIDEERIDIVHAHGTRANSNMFWAARKSGLPIIYTCHAWSFHIDQNPIVKSLRIWSEEYLTSKMNVNICGSEANRNTGKKLFKNFEALIIHNSIDPAKFNPYKKEYKDVRKELGILKDDLIVAAVARFTLQKQPLKLIKAFAEVARDITNVKLLMVGDGELKEEAIRLIDKLGIRDRVILQPFREDIPDVLAAVDIFVLPSLWEAFPIALLEAMSMGKAVIATSVDGTPEIISHGQNGLMLSIDEVDDSLAGHIRELCQNRELREQLQKNAIESIYNRYNADTMAKKNEEVYTQLFYN